MANTGLRGKVKHDLGPVFFEELVELLLLLDWCDDGGQRGVFGQQAQALLLEGKRRSSR